MYSSIYLTVYLSVYLPTYPPIHPSIYLSIYIYISMYECIYLILSGSMCIYLYLYVPICIYLYLCLYMYLCYNIYIYILYLASYLNTYQSIHLCMYLSTLPIHPCSQLFNLSGVFRSVDHISWLLGELNPAKTYENISLGNSPKCLVGM